jgi:hypothetical protein
VISCRPRYRLRTKTAFSPAAINFTVTVTLLRGRPKHENKRISLYKIRGSHDSEDVDRYCSSELWCQENSKVDSVSEKLLQP